MQRRHLLLAVLAAGPLATGAHAQTEAAAPLVGAPKILQALNPKDVAIDRPGQDPSIALQVQFGFDSAELTPHGQRQLDELARALADRSLATAAFELGGHTDRVGEHGYNMRLSQARARAVMQYLQTTHGVQANRLQAVGYGFTRPIDPARPAAPINRRVEVRRLAGTVQAPNLAPSNSPPPAGHGSVVPSPR